MERDKCFRCGEYLSWDDECLCTEAAKAAIQPDIDWKKRAMEAEAELAGLKARYASQKQQNTVRMQRYRAKKSLSGDPFQTRK